MQSYKNVVAVIRNLFWRRLSGEELQVLMILSAYTAREFAASLRIALELNPLNQALREMAMGELGTDNLRFADYDRTGDHYSFLEHFIDQHGFTNLSPQANSAAEEYLSAVMALPREVRAMSIVSRERELPGIFGCILEAPDWSHPALAAFRYYLEEHIRLDSMEGGHAALLSKFEVTEEVRPFYEARLKLYNCLPTLFE